MSFIYKMSVTANVISNYSLLKTMTNTSECDSTMPKATMIHMDDTGQRIKKPVMGICLTTDAKGILVAECNNKFGDVMITRYMLPMWSRQ